MATKSLAYFKRYETILLSLLPCERGDFKKDLKEVQECIAELEDLKPNNCNNCNKFTPSINGFMSQCDENFDCSVFLGIYDDNNKYEPLPKNSSFTCKEEKENVAS